jgi:hypothetical protein
MEFPGRYSLAKQWLIHWSGVDDFGMHLLAGMVLFALFRLLFDSPRWLALVSTAVAAALNEVIDALHAVLPAQAIGEDILVTVAGANLALIVSYVMPLTPPSRAVDLPRATGGAPAPDLGSLPA